jgi:cobalt-zinc-cadmium efflux system membrane fusion protein
MTSLRALRALRGAPLLLVLLIGCREAAPPPAPMPPDGEIWLGKEAMEKGNVKLTEVREREIPQAVLAAGRIAFDDLRVTHVFSPVTGRITKVLARLGAHVKKGAPLVAIVSPDVGSAFSDLVKARADLVAARHEYERQEKLWEAQAGSKRDLENATDSFHKAQAEEQRAAMKVKLLKSGSVDSVSQEYTLRSYLEGDVIARMVNPGVEVQGQYSGGTAVELFTIGDIDQVWAYADIPESELPRVHQGDPVSLSVIAYPEERFHGRVEWISTALDPALRTARVRLSLPNPGKRLKPEMYATVSIGQASKKMLAVPRKAVAQIGEQSFVYVAAGARPGGKSVFKRRRIQVSGEHEHKLKVKQASSEVLLPQISAPEEELLPIEAGLIAGESVIVEGAVAREAQGDEAWVTPDQLRAANIEVAKVEPREVKDALAIGGRLAFDDQRVSHVFSPVTGRVTKVSAHPGQRVKKGAPLATIASPDLGAAFADMIKAKADLTAAEHEVRRQRELFAAQAGARRDLEIAEDNYGKAKAEYDRAEKKTRHLRSGAANALTQEYLLRSPIDGLIVARNANPGMEVQGQYSNANTSI